MQKNHRQNNPKIAIITVTYNASNFLESFIDCCDAQAPRNINLQYYVIDNDSRDETRDILQRKTASNAWNIIYNKSNVGIAAANNQGIIKAIADKCEYIILLNNDTSFESDFFQALYDHIIKTGAQVVVPKIYYDTPPNTIWYGGGDFAPLKGMTGRHIGINETDSIKFNDDKNVDYAPTCAMLLHAKVFHAVHLMDESYFVYFDDTDFCLRLKRKKIDINYTAATSMVHKVGGSTGGRYSEFTVRMTARNRLYYISRHFGDLAALAWAPVFILHYIFQYITGRMSGKILSIAIKSSLSYKKIKPAIRDVAGKIVNAD